ncbi:methionine--tRNA ligase [Anaplasma marginale]|uniref:methionine--tRNA ligase n=1 Tax=Anaplasma marginale TaxID=770 RepID=UPI0005B3EA8D|nr:methionine--tRNA ligase [Anaplasma marginale]
MRQGECFYVTTPIYYVNDTPHIGHFYTTLISDVAARFRSLSGKQVKFTTGTDEHGQKVENMARARGVPVRQFVDEISGSFRNLVGVSGFSCNDFIRTTEERHKRAVLALWERLRGNNQIYLGHYAGFYSVRDETFYQERDLVDGKAPTGAEVEWLEEPGYFFKLSEWQESLLKFYADNPKFVIPEGKFNEVISFVESGLRDLSVSRSKKSLSWGIEVPHDSDHIIYIWVDALCCYLALLGFPETEGEYKRYWGSDGAVSTHVVGKDILRFHAVYWPALLMAADLPLPKQIVAHGWWLNEGQKISKSIGNVIDPFALIEQYGLDNCRYFLLSETPVGNDASFSGASLVERINCDLANNFGNLVQRTITLVHRECGGKIPEVEGMMQGEEAPINYEAVLVQYVEYMAEYRFFEALKFVMNLSSVANEYIARRAPWKLFKEDRKSAQAVVFKLLEYIRCIGIMLQPFVPDSASKILDQISLPADRRSFEHFSEFCRGGVSLGTPTPVFGKLYSTQSEG